MKIAEPLRQGQFQKRYKRFFADVILDGKPVVAHVPNTGSLKTCLFPGFPCIISESLNPERKLKATLHFLKTPTGWVGVNTSLPNKLVFEAWAERMVSDWHQYSHAQQEFKISSESRLDLVLARDTEAFAARRELNYIEIKNVTYAEGGVARFPDAVTERGQKHLRELMKLRGEGHGAEIVFVVQREDCTSFAPADDIDPEYGRLLREAVAAGVKVRAFACTIDPQAGVAINPKPLSLNF